jgi:hypothetical protein
MNLKQIFWSTCLLGGLLALSGCSERVTEAPIRADQGVDAAARLVALSSGEDATADDWFALAQDARKGSDYATAAEALDMAAKDLAPIRIALEKARLSVAQGNRDEAVETLQALFDRGFNGAQLISGDEVLGALKGTDGFDTLVAAMSKRAYPCQHDEKFREFDFWIGAWDVHTATGQLAGSNRIERAERGCMLTEHWTNTTGGTGTSINYLDKSTDKWVQVWNSEGGGQIQISGGLTDEGMRLVGTLHNVANGQTSRFRGLWTPLDDGRVRQYFEQSNDGGKTWAPWFEGFYSRQSGAEQTESN